MSEKRYALRHDWRQRLSGEPSTTLFKKIRLELMLWYSSAFAGALLLFSTVLYLGVSHTVFASIDADLSTGANLIAAQWQRTPVPVCPLPLLPPGSVTPPIQPRTSTHLQVPPLVACFKQDGTPTLFDNSVQIPSAFLESSLVKAALKKGEMTDTVNGGGSYGDIRRYALIVRNPQGNDILGVIQVGESMKGQEDALHILLVFLLTLGSGTLLLAALGGFLLARRALVPARLAFTRQQRFVADASHELRTPLTLLRADAEVLLSRRGSLAPDDAALLEDIAAEATHMTALATNMLTLARLDTQRVHRAYDIIRLDEVASRLLRRATPYADAMGIHVQDEKHPENVSILGDTAQIEQALLVLLDNAIKYNSRDGHVMVQTYVMNEQAHVEVRDTGRGIAAEHLPHLGERFYRVDEARTDESEGTGLGLSIAYNIIALHGGTLKLTSMPGQGTTAHLMLPLFCATTIMKDQQGRHVEASRKSL